MSLAVFSSALSDPQTGTPDGLVGPDGKKAAKRFNVYRNNVTVGLIGALADTFPAVQRLVGEQFFEAMARVYVQTEPPSSPLLFRYGDGFADFLEHFEPAQHLVYLPDVARLERAWLDAYHAADAPVLAPEALSTVAPEDLADQRFDVHPATRIIRSRFAAISIFSANRMSDTVPSIDTSVAEDGLITRRDTEVEIRHLPPGAAAFFSALVDGQPLGAAAEVAVSKAEDFNLASAIGAMLEAGVFTGLADTGRGEADEPDPE
ncbi:MAG: DNA-binding domain-containing protein [Alphaproteobacteria bacterium]|nr:DNA-binding domain-containing protein [Alphaproteobacteria bacterium]